MKGKNFEPLAGHLLYAGEITDTTAKGILAYPGIETSVGETEVTYTDNSKTIVSISETDAKTFEVSAATNLFVGQAIKLDTQVAVITGIDGTDITVDRDITAEADDSVTESAYYSVHRKDKDADPDGNWYRHARYFFIEVKGDSNVGRQDLVFPNDLNKDDYYVDSDISTKPISMLKINGSNTSATLYYFKVF